MRQTNTKTKTRKSTTEERTKKNYQSGYEMRMKMRLAFVLTLITFVIIVYDHFFRDTERTFGCIFSRFYRLYKHFVFGICLFELMLFEMVF